MNSNVSIIQQIKLNPKSIRYINELSHEMCLEAVKRNGDCLRYIDSKYRTDDVCRAAIENNPFAIRHIGKNKQTAELCAFALEKNPAVIQHIRIKSPHITLAVDGYKLGIDGKNDYEYYLNLIKLDGKLILTVPSNVFTFELNKEIEKIASSIVEFNKLGLQPDAITNQLCIPSDIVIKIFDTYLTDYTSQLYLEAIRQDCNILRLIPNQTYDVCLEAIKQHGLLLQYVKEEFQSNELCLEAVKNNYKALQYVKDQTTDICSCAIKQNGVALQFVQEVFQTDEFCLEAVNQDGLLLQYVKNQTPELCLKAVESCGEALEFVKVKTPDICYRAVTENGYAIRYVDHITPVLLLRAILSNSSAIKYVPKNVIEECLHIIETK
jgi:hypothetical protein